jgi:predicted DCC family thiol-disulfide oxidoreductase YuxK
MAELAAMDAPLVGPTVFVYDATCVLCSRAANFVARRDRQGRFWYADMSTETGRGLMRAHGIEPDGVDAVVLIDGERAWVGSTAALRIAGLLGQPWSWVRVLLVVPVRVREPAYRFVARNRHRIFGRGACPVPEAGLRERSLP